MAYVDKVFKKNIRKIMKHGTLDENPRPKYKDGTPAYTKFITQVYEEYDLSKGQFPITSLRPIAWKSAIKESLWIYQDKSNDLSVLKDKYNVHYWDDWGIGDGTIGFRYGKTVKEHNIIDDLIYNLKNNPFGRRHIINLWQLDDFKKSDGLLPCAFQTLWSVRKIKDEYYLDCTLTQRSSDYLVAGHINMIQYVALQMMIAHECGYKIGKFARLTQNLHIYDRHMNQAKELLKRKAPFMKNPKLVLNAEGKSFYQITIDDFEIIDYEPVKPQIEFELGI